MKLTSVQQYPRYRCGTGIRPSQVHNSTQSALSAHSADCCYYLHFSFRCENPRQGLDFQLPVRALVHCCQGDRGGRACAAAGEDASTADPGDVVDSKVQGSGRID